MPDPVRLTVVSNEPEAELVMGLLRNSDIRCTSQISNFGFGSGGEIVSSGAGQRDVLVMPEDLERARAVLDAPAPDVDDEYPRQESNLQPDG